MQWAPEWLPIESAPKDGSRLMITDGSDVDIACWEGEVYEKEEFVRDNRDGERVYKRVTVEDGYWDAKTVVCPTHWARAPALPASTDAPAPHQPTVVPDR